jgi:hypothetical protein
MEFVLDFSVIKPLLTDAISPLNAVRWWTVSASGDDTAPDWRSMRAVAARWLTSGKPVVVRRFAVSEHVPHPRPDKLDLPPDAPVPIVEARREGIALWTLPGQQRAFLAEVEAEPVRPSITPLPSLSIARDPVSKAVQGWHWSHDAESLCAALALSWWPGWDVRAHGPRERVLTPPGACRHNLRLVTGGEVSVWTLVATMPRQSGTVAEMAHIAR